MTKSEALIRTILGPVRRDIRPLAYAVDITAGYLFVRNIPMEEIHITKQIYPAVSERIGKTGVVWRYDPIIVNERYGADFHRAEFPRMCEKLAPYTDTVTVSSGASAASRHTTV